MLIYGVAAVVGMDQQPSITMGLQDMSIPAPQVESTTHQKALNDVDDCPLNSNDSNSAHTNCTTLAAGVGSGSGAPVQGEEGTDVSTAQPSQLTYRRLAVVTETYSRWLWMAGYVTFLTVMLVDKNVGM